MESLMAVHQNAEGIIGKFFYYSTSNILIPKTKFIEIGQAFGLPKYKPAKESKAVIKRWLEKSTHCSGKSQPTKKFCAVGLTIWSRTMQCSECRARNWLCGISRGKYKFQ